ncbi:MAG TPA: serine/threonine-protein kinase [Gemmatimonadaceae bacterium]|nr:serine/threonine-protein kinase [Gemmatimonadaceae bacterium]
MTDPERARDDTPPERWTRVRAAVEGALALPADERDAYVDSVCGDDPTLRTAVERLLVACERVDEADSLFARPAAEFAAPLVSAVDAQQARTRGRTLALLRDGLASEYEIEREIGAGGMATIYLAHDRKHHRAVAIKVLRPDLAASLGVDRFVAEIQVMAQLQHPNLVPLLDSGETNGLLYYVMPFVDGQTLRSRMADRTALPIAEATRVMRELATALAYAHAKGVVHRDIKPENVLLSGGVALLADFGIAKALLASTIETRGATTTTGVAIGTPAYMAPEQLLGEAGVDQRADLYALGMITYEMLTGEPPFAGRSVQDVATAHVFDAPGPIQDGHRSLPASLASLVMQCLEKRPADRPQHAAEIVRVLDELATSGERASTVLPPRRRRGRTRLAAYALGAGALLAAAWGVRTTRARGALAMKPAAVGSRLLIAPFENLTGDPRFDLIGRIVAERLSFDVAQVGKIGVVPSNVVLMALRDTSEGMAERMRNISDVTHAGLLLSGSVLLRSDSLLMHGQATDVATGQIVFTLESATAASDDPIAAIDALGDRLRGALGTREIGIFPAVTRAPKYAAYQQFAAGFDRFAVQGDGMGSRPFFERAIAIDSSYARAYLLLSRQYLNAGEYARSDSILRRLDRLPFPLSESDRLFRMYSQAELDGDLPRMLLAQQKVVALDSNPLSLELSGEAGLFLLRADVAVPAYERADSAFQLIGGHALVAQTIGLGFSYHLAGAHDREVDLWRRRGAQFANPALGAGARFRAFAGHHQPAPALELAETVLPPGDDSAGSAARELMIGAQEFRAHGDPATALRLSRIAGVWYAAHPVSRASSQRLVQEGLALLMSGSADGAARRFGLAARDTTRLDAAGYLGLIAVSKGERARARIIADSLGALRRPFLFGANLYWRAAILGALGERELAVQLLAEAHREGQMMMSWHADAAFDSLRSFPAFQSLVRPRT